MIFALLSCIFMILAIFAKFIYKLKEKNFSLIVIIILNIFIGKVSEPSYGGLVLGGEEYFKHNLTSYLAMLSLIIIYVNLFINYITQSKEMNKKKVNKF